VYGVITNVFETDDGVALTYYEVGAGRPLVLLHGYMFPAIPTWVDTKIADRLVGDGHRLIMLDLRGHGASVPAVDDAYPPDALATDVFSLIAHMELAEYDLGGYSLGARIVARALTLGAEPRRAFIAGTGLDPIVHASGRGENYRRILSKLGEREPGTPESDLEGYLKQVGANPAALIRVLDTLVDTAQEGLARVEVPTLVIAGDRDGNRGSVEDLAAILPNARLQRVPGDHYSALTSTELRDHLARFLSDDDFVADIQPGTRRP
jgi:pimeloyl-ACP methyl ester carboxylesterase